jgi:hypothetical protein
MAPFTPSLRQTTNSGEPFDEIIERNRDLVYSGRRASRPQHRVGDLPEQVGPANEPRARRSVYGGAVTVYPLVR